MSRLGVYDNWGRLVGAVTEREELQRLAFCNSFSSTSSTTTAAASISGLSSVGSSFNYANLELDLVTEQSRPRASFAPSNNANTQANGQGGVAAFLFAAPLAYYRRKKLQREYDLLEANYFLDVPVRQLNQLERFSLGELHVATDSFSNKSKLGRGGFGNVYKGRLADGSLVAVKRLISGCHTHRRDNQFHAEIKVKLNMGEHPNILQLRGFCLTSTERLLVYPYMANGSVSSCLREWIEESQPPLDWPTRERIALGSAKGLAYLHDQCHKKIIHCDIKAANILLNEDFEAVIGDFGCATLMNQEDTEHVKTAIVGTLHHMAPEYRWYGKVSEKTDVFGYGVMLLELTAGLRASDLARLASEEDVRLQDWVKGLLNEKRLESLVDARGNYNYGKVEKLVQVALLCCHQGSPEKRPNMSDVVQMLQGDDGLAERWHEYCHEEEIFPQESSYAHYDPDTDWSNANSTSSVDDGEFELSGPR